MQWQRHYRHDLLVVQASAEAGRGDPMTPNKEIVAWLREQRRDAEKIRRDYDDHHKTDSAAYRQAVRDIAIIDAAANALEAADGLAGQVVLMRETLESINRRTEADPDDIESVEQCNHCGDLARDHIDTEQWEFTSKGDMLCRYCGGDRCLVGYEVGGIDDGEEEIKAALALPLPQAAAQVAEWREKAGLLDWAALRSDFTGVRTERRNYHLSIGCSPPKSYTADDLIEALRAAKEQG